MRSVIKNPDLIIRMRSMESCDIDQILQMEQEIFDDPWPRAEFEDSLDDPSVISIVALSDSEIIGYTCLLLDDDHVHLTNIAIAEGWRRKSVANRLMERIFEIVIKSEYDNLLLEVRPSNITAIKLYEKFGFTELMRRKNYYCRPVEEAMVMVACPEDLKSQA